jgi:hypothetical protein
MKTMVAPEFEVDGAWSKHAMGVFEMLNNNPNVNIHPPLYALIMTQMVCTHFRGEPSVLDKSSCCNQSLTSS